MAILNSLFRSAATRSPPVRAMAFSSLSSTATQDPGFRSSVVRKAAAPAARRGAGKRNVQWVFLGCPGVGNGTYASRLSNLLGIPHIATGDLVRDDLNSSGPLSKQKFFLDADGGDESDQEEDLGSFIQERWCESGKVVLS